MSSEPLYPKTPDNIDKSIIEPSEDFKRGALLSVLSIILFMLVYLALLSLTVCFTVFAVYAGIAVIVLHPSLITLVLGAGIAGIGLMLLYFVIKFIFSNNKTDRSGMLELKREEEPALFVFIEKIAGDVQAPFPYKIYVTPEVNASVFYDSGFWSMFLPVKKNLQIGLGLVNSVTVSEFKAIMAHEFGHFSQKSMKIGSYVYNVNKILYNMLYDNESYGQTLQKFSSINNYFTFFAKITVWIIEGIQWVLQKVYNVVNINYMKLSREMEFHADAVAASISGSRPLIDSLRRIELADAAFNNTLSYYDTKISSNVSTQNVYPQHRIVMGHIARLNELAIEHDLPVVDEASLSRFNKSKMVIKDQWASHPSTNDRAARLNRLNISSDVSNASAWAIFSDEKGLQERMNHLIFSNVKYEKAPELLDAETFRDVYLKDNAVNSFDEQYNNYYDSREISTFDIAMMEQYKPAVNYSSIREIYSTQNGDLLYLANGMAYDMQLLEAIKNDQIRVNNFEYDGKKYQAYRSYEVYLNLKDELEKINKDLDQRDRDICFFFWQKAREKHTEGLLQQRYEAYFSQLKQQERDRHLFESILTELQKSHTTLPFHEIELFMQEVYRLEKEIKERIAELIATQLDGISDEDRLQLQSYIKENRKYFNGKAYDEPALEHLYKSLNAYIRMSGLLFFNRKKELLDYQLSLVV